jgi:predicted nucleotidyltransferase
VKHTRAWWQERSRGFLSECARLIVNRIGSGTVEAVFLCGSFATGDETIVLETTAAPILLSDVDLVVIVASLANLSEWAPRRGELGAACENLMREVRFSGRVDVGVMLARDLEELPARPGVYDMRARGRVLAGNPRILELIPDYAPSDITVREALTLIGNRGVALLDSLPPAMPSGDAETFGYRYRIARVYTDIAAAALSTAGEYVPGYAARSDLIRRMIGDRDTLITSLVPPGVLADIERWTRFKLEPSIESAGSPAEPGVFEGLWEKAARDILYFWRQTAGRVLDPRRDLSDPLPIDALAGRTGAYRDWRRHVRAWRAYLSRLPAPRRIALAAALRSNMLSANPLDVVRDEGMKLIECRLARGREARIPGARGGFPHRGGHWEGATGELCSIWNDLVFGRRNG